MTKYELVDLKHSDVHECESIDAMIDICRDLNINAKTAVGFRMDDDRKPYIIDLRDAALSRLCIDTGIRFQNMFGVKQGRYLYGTQNLLNDIRKDVMESSAFEDCFKWNDDDISEAIVRVFNSRMDPAKNESDRLRTLNNEGGLDVVACVADNAFRIINMNNIGNYEGYDLFSIYNRITKIAVDCSARWEKMTEDEQDEHGWLCFVDEESEKMIAEEFADEIEWQKESAKHEGH